MDMVSSTKISTLNEKPLHESLKRWYARPGDLFEVPVDGFIVDIVRSDLLVEIQTLNFLLDPSETGATRSSSLCAAGLSYIE